YTGTKRQGDRLLTLDQPTADLLWVRLHAPLADVLGSHGATSTPLGFGVSGQWSLAGINPAMRVNAHTSTSSFFGPHYDAQRVASGHERALFSVIVYLNENEFEAGETAFHFPKKTEVDTYGMTVDEEIAARGGLAAGYTTRQVVPKVGRAVVFSQHVLHEALHATSASDKLARYVLRTDIMVTRPPQPYKVPLSERPSYNLVLEYFRRAQQHELQGELEAAGDLYERCLAIRYRFPASDDEDGSQDTLIRTTTPLDVIPPPVLELVGLFLDGSSLQSLVLAFPAMHWLQVATTAWAKSLVEALSQDTPLPFGAPVQTDMDVLDDLSSIVASSDSIEGTALWTAMHSAVFFDANVDGCCRVAALKTFFALGHTIHANHDVDAVPSYYCVNFDPETHETTVVERNHVLTAAFHNLPCFGAVFTVETDTDLDMLDDNTRDNVVEETFQDNVDRRYMMAAFGIEGIGRDVVGAAAEYYRATVLSGPFSELPTDELSKMAAHHGAMGAVAFGKRKAPLAAELPPAKRALLPHATTFEGFRRISFEGPKESWKEPLATHGINRLVFDFARASLAVVEVASDEEAYKNCRGACPKFSWADEVHDRFPDVDRVRHFIVHVGVVADAPAYGGFSHASYSTLSEGIKVDHIHLDHVHLRVLYAANGSVYMISTYGGIAAL
ncbi:hypothetical protein As57867_004538, partial [Aphanomyces stellatus]